MWPQLQCVFFGIKYSKNVYIAAFLYVVSLVKHCTIKGEQIKIWITATIYSILDTDLSKICPIHQTCHPARIEDFSIDGESDLIPVPVYSAMHELGLQLLFEYNLGLARMVMQQEKNMLFVSLATNIIGLNIAKRFGFYKAALCL